MPQHPLAFPDFSGRDRVEPSQDTQVRLEEPARFTGSNPFVATLLGVFPAGVLDDVQTYATQAAFLAARDPVGEGGDAIQAGAYAFRPGRGNAPPGAPLLHTVRVGDGASAPTPATLSLEAGGPVITLTTRDAGTHANDFWAKVEAGTGGVGRKVSVRYRDVPAWTVVGDKLGPVMVLSYTGGANSAELTITAAQPGAANQLKAQTQMGADPIVVEHTLDLTTAQFATVQDVVNYFNRQPNYSATLVESDCDVTTLASRELDAVADLSLLPADAENTLTANIGAIVHWFAQNVQSLGPVPGLTATRVAGQTTAPTTPAAYTRFAGGTTPAVAQDDYEAALAVLEREEVTSGILVLDTTDAAIQEAVRDWMDAQAAQGRRWRAVFAMAAGTTDLAARTRAGALADHRIALFHQRAVDTDGLTISPLEVAAAFAGATAGMVPTTDVQTLVLTEKPLRAAAIYKADRRTQPQREALLKAGVNVLRLARGTVMHALAISTDQGRKRALRMWAETVAIDLVTISVEDALRATQVAWATEQYVAVVQAAATTQLQGWADAGVITPGIDPATGAAVPAFTTPNVVTQAGQTTVEFDVSLAGETDHTRITATVRRVRLAA